MEKNKTSYKYTNGIKDMLKLNDKQTEGNYELKQTIKLNNLSIDILYNDEIDHELERENLIKEKDKLIYKFYNVETNEEVAQYK